GPDDQTKDADLSNPEVFRSMLSTRSSSGPDWNPAADLPRLHPGWGADTSSSIERENPNGQSSEGLQEQPANLVLLKLPRAVEVHVARGWWLLGLEHLRLIATTVEAAMDLSGFDLPKGEKTTLIAANSMPRTTYSALRINSTTPPSTTRAEMAAISLAEIS